MTTMAVDDTVAVTPLPTETDDVDVEQPQEQQEDPTSATPDDEKNEGGGSCDTDKSPDCAATPSKVDKKCNEEKGEPAEEAEPGKRQPFREANAPSLEDESSCFQSWTLSFLTPLLKYGSSNVIDSNDVGQPSMQDRSVNSFNTVSEAWKQEVERCEKKNVEYKKRFDEEQLKNKREEEQGKRGTVATVDITQRALVDGEEGSGSSTMTGDELEASRRDMELANIEAGMDMSSAIEEGPQDQDQEGHQKDSTEGKDQSNDDKTSSKTTSTKKGKKKKRKKKDEGPKKSEPSLALTMFRAFGSRRVLLAIGLYVVAAVLTFIPVLLLNDLVRYFESDGTQSFLRPWVSVVGLGIMPVITSMFQTRHSYIMTHFAVFVRTGCSTLLYKKSLRISATGRSRTSTGQVVNMMSNDTNQLMRFLQFAGMSFVAPIQVVIALTLIFQQVGNSMWVGVAYMVFLIPLNFKIFAVVGQMRRKVLKYSDSRVKMMNEILAGIRIIKFYAWEQAFGKEVGKVREEELQALTKLTYVSQIGFSIILLSAPLIQIMLVFLTYIHISDEPLTASKAFTTVALFQIMRFPFAIMPMGFLQYIQSKIAIRRIAAYLQLPELKDTVVYEPHPDCEEGDDGMDVGSVVMKHCSFSWVDPTAETKPLDGSRSKGKGGKGKAGPGGAGAPGGPGTKRRSSVFRKKGGKETSSRTTPTSSPPGISPSPTTDSADTNSTTPRDHTILRDVTCTIPSGSLVAVVGEVGSGKSSLLSAILGEMEGATPDSKVYIPRGSCEPDNFSAYCTQSPWVVNDTVRGNILFGRTMDEERYNESIQAAALLDDLSILPAGDMTEIGERGINLSGGQKARVSLARALYSRDTKLLLLDDPLSAVDAHVGEHLFREAISGPITGGVTRILVTHHVHFLPRCDSVIVMEKGRIAHHGRYEDLVESGVDFTGAVEITKKEEEDVTGTTAVAKEVENITKVSPMETGKEVVATAAPEKKDDVDSITSPVKPTAAETKEKAAQKKKGENLVEDEEREEGEVKSTAYIHYAKAGGLCTALCIMIGQIGARGFEIGATFWLAHWSDTTVSSLQAGNPLSEEQTTYFLNIYAAFGIASIVSLTARGLSMAVHRLKASRRLHIELATSILRAPVAFFDVTPTGRVLNRFAHDMDKVDLELTNSLSQGMNTMFSVFGALGAIIAATKGTFLVPLIPVGYAYYHIQRWFRKTSTELQRVTSMTMSPIFADFSQTLTGTPTIRAYGEQDRFFTKCQSSFDTNNASWILVQLSGLWLGLRLDFLGGFVAAFIGAIAVGTFKYNFIPAGWLGLSLSFSNEITSYLKHGVRMLATLEADMSSVERILHYARNIDHEAPDVIPEVDPKEGTWPSEGQVVVKNASMRYRDGPLVLKNLTFSVKSGEKVGVVGRTGSGKSSLMIALFRISELEQNGGQIIIDDVDTALVGTKALRSNLSIIPQDPVLFSNTVRYNLDPFGSKTEEELWSALKKVKLAEAIASLPCGIEEMVTEGGENFSQGQRQLLCIARSLLRNPKVLIMDEATASIDNSTDASIQEMIRENFAHATILTIAHRLNTIMDSDRILVLEQGEVAEFDTPEALLEKKDGLFSALVEKSRRRGSQTESTISSGSDVDEE